MGIQIKQEEHGALGGEIMIRDIKAILTLKKESEILNISIVLGTLVIGGVIAMLTSTSGITRKEMFMLVGGFMAFMYLIIGVMVKLFNNTEETYKGLSFGFTRRKLFTYSRLVDLAELIVLALIELIFFNEYGFTIIIRVGLILFGLVMWTEGIGGNSIIRYGKTAYIVYYVFMFVVMFGGPRLVAKVPVLKNGAIKFLEGLINPAAAQAPVWIGLIAFVVLGLIVNWITFRKIPVNQVLM